MGLAAENAVVYRARPRSWEHHRPYDAADGEVTYHVWMRRKLSLYGLLRLVYHVVTFLRPEVKNPTQIEFQGEWNDRALAHAFCETVEREYPGRFSFEVCPFSVNRAFPLEPVKWYGAYRFRPGEMPDVDIRGKVYELVDSDTRAAELTELREWRDGLRTGEGFRRIGALLNETLDRLATIEARLAALEERRDSTRGAT